jgi:DNA mismatch repair protein MutS
VAEVDVLSSLAWLSIERKYVRPELSLDGSLKLFKSRHPVVEVSMTKFISNDIALEQGQCLLITGPNMAGKSTVMRQVALSVILNQMGCFVPATKAIMPIYKTLHTRIGASDFLSQGLSTFMVEMSETAELLEQAGPDSLIILDEIGRGTSTYDGLSLAQAILEELLDKGASFMFSTHYQELTDLEHDYSSSIETNGSSRIQNMSMGVKKDNDKIFFEYVFKKGAAEKSYGIEVAKIAGVKHHVIARAQELLQGWEGGDQDETRGRQSRSDQNEVRGQKSGQLSLSFESPQETSPPVDPKILELIEKIKAFSTNDVTPLQALNEISVWQKNL